MFLGDSDFLSIFKSLSHQLFGWLFAVIESKLRSFSWVRSSHATWKVAFHNLKRPTLMIWRYQIFDKNNPFFCAVLKQLNFQITWRFPKLITLKKIQTLIFIFFVSATTPPFLFTTQPAELDVARDSAPAAGCPGGTGGGTGPVLCKVTAGGGGTMFFKTSAEGA